MSTGSHPNFPEALDITPLALAGENEEGSAFEAGLQSVSIERYGIAGRVWEAAHLLVQYFRPDAALEYDPPCSLTTSKQYRPGDHPLRILELGSGTGYVGLKIVSSLLHRDAEDFTVILTDLPDVCPLIEQNLKIESRAWAPSPKNGQNIRVRPLAWGNEHHAQDIASELHPTPISHLICSDLVYFPHLLAPLLRSLIHLTSSTSPEIIISYKIRNLTKETPFWSAFGLWFSFKPVLVRPIPISNTYTSKAWGRYGSDNTEEDPSFVFIAFRREESMSWNVPSDDADLLNGVGARGTETRKADDTFESLLFMLLDSDSDG